MQQETPRAHPGQEAQGKAHGRVKTPSGGVARQVQPPTHPKDVMSASSRSCVTSISIRGTQ